MRVSRVVVALLVLLLTSSVTAAVAAVGSSPPSDAIGPVSPATRERIAARALGRWAGFPVRTIPRPIVVGGDGPIDLPIRGRSAARFRMGHYRLLARLPPTPGPVNGQRLLSPARALAELRTASRQGLPRGKRGALITIVSVRLGSGAFSTDRGTRTEPAWLFSCRGSRAPARVLAAVAYPQPAETHDPLPFSILADGVEDSATASDAGRRLTVSFIGGPAGDKPCDDNYDATTYASRTAVAVIIHTDPAPLNLPPGGGIFCSDVGYRRTVHARLARPLGARVLIDGADATAIPVTAARHS